MKALPLPCCYHPTTVLLVDDNELFLATVSQDIEELTPYRTFASPLQAKVYLDKMPSYTFVDRCKEAPEPDLEDHNVHVLQQIHKEMYDPLRFEQTSVAIIDYQMPGMNGLELCAVVRERFPHIKLVLLTAEADHALAVKAFNEGYIDRFIKKNERNLSDTLKKTIRELQWQYFGGLSQQLLDNLIQHIHPVLPIYFKRPEFAEFFITLFQKHRFCEFYLLETNANFLLLDDKGQPAWLMVRDENELERETMLAQEYYDEHVSPQTANIMKSLASRLSATMFLTEEDNRASIEQWGRLMHPLTPFQLGRDAFYYSLIQNNPQCQLNEADRVVSFSQRASSIPLYA
jgi:CheY-like chemotaxis protein